MGEMGGKENETTAKIRTLKLMLLSVTEREVNNKLKNYVHFR